LMKMSGKRREDNTNKTIPIHYSPYALAQHTLPHPLRTGNPTRVKERRKERAKWNREIGEEIVDGRRSTAKVQCRAAYAA